MSDYEEEDVTALARRAWIAIQPEAANSELAINAICCLLSALIKSLRLDPEDAVVAIAESLLANLRNSKASPIAENENATYFEGFSKKEYLN